MSGTRHIDTHVAIDMGGCGMVILSDVLVLKYLRTSNVHIIPHHKAEHQIFSYVWAYGPEISERIKWPTTSHIADVNINSGQLNQHQTAWGNNMVCRLAQKSTCTCLHISIKRLVCQKKVLKQKDQCGEVHRGER
jgi:hypothetical protein